MTDAGTAVEVPEERAVGHDAARPVLDVPRPGAHGTHARRRPPPAGRSRRARRARPAPAPEDHRGGAGGVGGDAGRPGRGDRAPDVRRRPSGPRVEEVVAGDAGLRPAANLRARGGEPARRRGRPGWRARRRGARRRRPATAAVRCGDPHVPAQADQRRHAELPLERGRRPGRPPRPSRSSRGPVRCPAGPAAAVAVEPDVAPRVQVAVVDPRQVDRRRWPRASSLEVAVVAELHQRAAQQRIDQAVGRPRAATATSTAATSSGSTSTQRPGRRLARLRSESSRNRLQVASMSAITRRPGARASASASRAAYRQEAVGPERVEARVRAAGQSSRSRPAARCGCRRVRVRVPVPEPARAAARAGPPEPPGVLETAPPEADAVASRAVT